MRFELVVLDDMDFHLRLLLKGYCDNIITWMVQGQSESGADGGCSDYRTGEVQEKWARAFATRFPNYVRLTKKTTKGGWFGEESQGQRYDVTVSWAKAYIDGVKNRNQLVDGETTGE